MSHDFWDGLKKRKNPKLAEAPKLNQKKVSIDGLSKPQKKPVVNQVSTKPRATKKVLNFRLILMIIGCFIALELLILGIVFVFQVSKPYFAISKMFREGKYLVIFQNNAEIRSSGGFMGSFATVEFRDYQIKKIDFNTNIFKLDQAYSATHIIPPPPALEGITKGKWTLRDSNFAVSYPDAAQKIEWFYGQETGDSVDGVVTINASAIQSLLSHTGPINLDQYDLQITAENFFNILTTQIEKTYYQNAQNVTTNEPKAILKDLLPKVLDTAFALDKIKLIKIMFTFLNQKEIQLFVNNSQIEAAILGQKWGGKVMETSSDYLLINNTNLSEAKSSLNIKESLEHKVTEGEGVVTAKLTVLRVHDGSAVWPDGTDRNYQRILVPYGAVLQSATLNGKNVMAKVELGEESGKTYFGIITETAPQAKSLVELTYTLPIHYGDYSLTIQKQSGSFGDPLVVQKDGTIIFQGVLREDMRLTP